MKKHFFLFVICIMLASVMPAAAAPVLDSILPSDMSLIVGQPGWSFLFSSTEGGALALQLLSGDSGDVIADLGAKQVDAGQGRIEWNGLLPDGSRVAPGDYMIAVQLRNYWGEESEKGLMSVSLYDSADDAQAEMLDLSALIVEEAQSWDEGLTQVEEQDADVAPQTLLDDADVPVATSFWDMNPDAYDLGDPAHQQAIWDLMMQPITVI